MLTVLRSRAAYPQGIKPLEVARAAGEAERPDLWSRGALIVPAAEVGGHMAGHGVLVGRGALQGSAKWIAGKYGPAVDVRNADAMVVWPDSAPAMNAFSAGLDGITVMAVWTHMGVPSNLYCHLFGQPESGSATNSRFAIRSHTVSGANRISFMVEGRRLDSLASPELVVGRTYLYVGTWKASTRMDLRIYDLDAGGVLYNSTGSGLSIPASITADVAPLKMGGHEGRSPTGIFHAGYILPKAITQDEADRWAADPFAPLRPAPYRVVQAAEVPPPVVDLPAAPSALAVQISDTIVAANLAWADNDQLSTQYVHRLSSNTPPADSSTRISAPLAPGTMDYADEAPLRGEVVWYAIEAENAEGSRYSSPVRGIVPDFYVDPAGDDGADGTTPATAWATGDPVAGILASESVALKCGGVWSEQFTLRSGVEGALTTYSAYGTGPRPIVQGANHVPAADWTLESALAGGDRYSAAFTAATPGYCWEVAGPDDVENLRKEFSLAGCDAPGDWYYSAGILYTVVPTGAGAPAGFHAGARGRAFYGGIGKSYVRLLDLHARFSNTGSVDGLIYGKHGTIPSTGWEVDNLLVEWGASTGLLASGIDYSQSAHIKVTRTEIRYCREHGAQLQFYVDSESSGNHIHSNGRSGFGFIWRGGAFRYDTYSYNGNARGLWKNPAVVQGYDHGSYNAGDPINLVASHENEFLGCVAHHNAKGGFATDALSDRHLYRGCASWGNTLFGLFLEGGTENGSAGTRLQYCSFTGNGKSGLHVNNGHGPFEMLGCLVSGNGLDGSQDVYVQFQIAGTWVNHAGAIYKRANVRWAPGALAAPIDSVLEAVPSLGEMVAGSWFFDPGVDGLGTLYVWRTDSAAVTEAICLPAGVVMDYNGYTPAAQLAIGAKIARFNFPGGADSYTDLGALRAAHPTLEVHGIQADPLYADPANGDLTLLEGSPAIGAGPGGYDLGSLSTAPADGVDPVTAGGAGVLPGLIGAGEAAASVAGSMAGALPALLGSAIAQLEVHGGGVCILPGLHGAGEIGGAPSTSASGSATLPALQGSGVGQLAVQGSGAGAVPAVSAGGSAAAEVEASGAPSLPMLQGSGELGGIPTTHGSGTATLPPLGSAGAAAIEIGAAGAGMVPALVGGGAASVAVDVFGAGVLPALRAVAGGVVIEISASGAGVLPMLGVVLGRAQEGELLIIPANIFTVPPAIRTFTAPAGSRTFTV